MSGHKVEVAMVLTPDPDLVSAVGGAVGVLAAQLGFGDAQKRALQNDLEQACRQMAIHTRGKGAELRLILSSFADRLELVVENGPDGAAIAPTREKLSGKSLDRVEVAESEAGKLRVKMVQYVGGGSQ